LSVNDFRTRLQSERPYLLRYASLQLRDPSLAEDAVQETLVAALAGEAGFQGRANLRTWLTGIHTIRRLARDAAAAPADADTAEFDTLFVDNGHWGDPPAAWADPDASLEQKRFFSALETCLERLPKKTAQAFMMREHLGLETAEICKELAITPTHCWVLLYRARMALRECLEKDWFSKI
jgi:RNA polymerase sigma-70 factor (ECF subfamily)